MLIEVTKFNLLDSSTALATPQSAYHSCRPARTADTPIPNTDLIGGFQRSFREGSCLKLRHRVGPRMAGRRFALPPPGGVLLTGPLTAALPKGGFSARLFSLARGSLLRAYRGSGSYEAALPGFLGRTLRSWANPDSQVPQVRSGEEFAVRHRNKVVKVRRAIAGAQERQLMADSEIAPCPVLLGEEALGAGPYGTSDGAAIREALCDEQERPQRRRGDL
jgi:hypothetical protein